MVIKNKVIMRNDVQKAMDYLFNCPPEKSVIKGKRLLDAVKFRKEIYSIGENVNEVIKKTVESFKTEVKQDNGEKIKVLMPAQKEECDKVVDEILEIDNDVKIDFSITFAECEKMGMTIEQIGGLSELGIVVE